MPRKFAWIFFIFILGIGYIPENSRAEPFVIAVEDKDWDPYYLWRDGNVSGVCVDLANQILKKVGRTVKFVPRPWVRVLHEVKTKKVDAGLCGSRTDDRLTWAHFVDESIFDYGVTLFLAKNSNLYKNQSTDFSGKIIGILRGYSYVGAKKFVTEKGASLHAFNTRKAIILNMVRGRIDGAVDDVFPFMPIVNQLGHSDKVIAYQTVSENAAYLFLSMKPAYEDLAAQLSQVLIKFKKNPEYKKLLNRYGASE